MSAFFGRPDLKQEDDDPTRKAPKEHPFQRLAETQDDDLVRDPIQTWAEDQGTTQSTTQQRHVSPAMNTPKRHIPAHLFHYSPKDNPLLNPGASAGLSDPVPQTSVPFRSTRALYQPRYLHKPFHSSTRDPPAELGIDSFSREPADVIMRDASSIQRTQSPSYNDRPRPASGLANYPLSGDDIRSRIAHITAQHAKSASLSSLGSPSSDKATSNGSPAFRRSLSPRPLSPRPAIGSKLAEPTVNRQYPEAVALETEQEAEAEAERLFSSYDFSDSSPALSNPSAGPSRSGSRLTTANIRAHDRKSLEHFGNVEYLDMDDTIGLEQQAPNAPAGTGIGTGTGTGAGADDGMENVNIWDSFDKLVGDEATLSKAIEVLFDESKKLNLNSASESVATYKEVPAQPRLNSIEQLRTLCLDIERTKRILDGAQQRHKLQCELQNILDEPDNKVSSPAKETLSQSRILEKIDENLKKSSQLDADKNAGTAKDMEKDYDKIFERKLKPSPDIKSTSDKEHEKETQTRPPRTPTTFKSSMSSSSESAKSNAPKMRSKSSSQSKAWSIVDKSMTAAILITAYLYISQQLPLLLIVDYFREVDRLYSYGIPLLAMSIFSILTSQLQLTHPFKNTWSTLATATAFILFTQYLLVWIRIHNYYYVRCKLQAFASAGLRGAVSHPSLGNHMSYSSSASLSRITRRLLDSLDGVIYTNECPIMADPAEEL